MFYIYEIVLFLLVFLLFFRSSQYTAQILVGRGRRGRAQASFSEARRNLSRKAGKKGGESRPQSLLSSAHGGKILQDFFRSLRDPPFFPVFLLKFLPPRKQEAAESSAAPGRSASVGAYPPGTLPFCSPRRNPLHKILLQQHKDNECRNDGTNRTRKHNIPPRRILTDKGVHLNRNRFRPV